MSVGGFVIRLADNIRANLKETPGRPSGCQSGNYPVSYLLAELFERYIF
jgi:hypothetical protein